MIMKLLITTQKVDIDDDVLGFVHNWISEFAIKFDSITVVCLFKGEYDLPKNVKVLSMGKEEYLSYPHIVRRIITTFRFYKHIWQNKRDYDVVFVHMNPEYIVLGGLLFKIWNKKICLWYTHKAVDWKLRIAEKLSDLIFTASEESFGLKSDKVKVLGHGIDLERFIPKKAEQSKSDKFKIVYVGRITKIKNQELLIKAISILVNEYHKKEVEVSLAGNAIYPADIDYLSTLKKIAQELKLNDNIKFLGSIPNREIGKIYQQSDLSINLCPTGGMDKAVLESWASGVPCIVFNKTFLPALQDFSELLLSSLDERELSGKIIKVMDLDLKRKKEISDHLLREVSEKHSLQNLVLRIFNDINSIK